jgi:hypothetical protein
MATNLTGTKIADTYEKLVKRQDSYSSTGNRIEIQNDSSVSLDTSLYLDVVNQRVGIGIASPLAPLQIKGVSQASWAGADANASFKIISGNAATDGLFFGIDTNSRAWIQSAQSNSLGTETHLYLQPAGGNVGIGTGAPDKTFHVWAGNAGSHTVNASTNVLIEDSGSNYIELATPAANEAGILFADPAGAPGQIKYEHSTDNMYITADDDILFVCEKVGIGDASPDATLDVAGTICSSVNYAGTEPMNVNVENFYVGWNLPTGGGSVSFVNGKHDASGNTYGTAEGFAFCQQKTNTTSEIMLIMSPSDGHLGALYPGEDEVFDLGVDTNARFDDFYITGTTGASDIREKKDIENSALGLMFINELNPVSFIWKTDKKPSNRRHYGLIAQEVKTVMDKLNIDSKDFAAWVDGGVGKKYLDANGKVATRPKILDENGNEPEPRQALRYDEFISPMIKAIQELSVKVTALEGEDSSSDTKIAALEAEDTANKAKVATLETEDVANKAKIVALEAKDAEYATTITALTARITALESA